MIKEQLAEAERRMQRSIEAVKGDLAKLRTGRASVSLIDGISVDYYGNPTPLNQVANLTVGDARTLVVTPWEKNMVQPIEKAIMSSELGLNPVTVGQVIRVPLPPLTEERRRDLVKVIKQEVENARVAIRNIRRDANNHVKDLLKKKEISEDEERRSEDAVQKLTDKFIAEVDKMLVAKESELLEV